MQAVTIPRVIAAVAVIATAGLVLVARLPEIDLPASPASTDAPPADTEPAPAADGERRVAVGETRAAAKLRELNEMSETFRNTTLLIAIRDAGFVCKELRSVYGGVNNSTTWTASCSEMLAYTVSVASEGTLHIEPLLEHLDAVPPVVPQQPQRELLPPQRR